MKIFLGANTAEICQAKVVFERAAAAWPSLLSLSLSPYLFLHFPSLSSLLPNVSHRYISFALSSLPPSIFWAEGGSEAGGIKVKGDDARAAWAWRASVSLGDDARACALNQSSAKCFQITN